MLVVILIGIAFLFLVSALPVTGNYKIKIVKSGSMEPAISTGSIVVVKAFSDYQAGDIITFGKDSKDQVPTTHRIVDIRIESGNPIYVTRGDANDTDDSKEVRKNEIIGRVLFHIPVLGYLIDFARQPLGFIVLIVLPAAIVIFDELHNVWKAIKEMRTKKISSGV